MIIESVFKFILSIVVRWCGIGAGEILGSGDMCLLK